MESKAEVEEQPRCMDICCHPKPYTEHPIFQGPYCWTWIGNQCAGGKIRCPGGIGELGLLRQWAEKRGLNSDWAIMEWSRMHKHDVHESLQQYRADCIRWAGYAESRKKKAEPPARAPCTDICCKDGAYKGNQVFDEWWKWRSTAPTGELTFPGGMKEVDSLCDWAKNHGLDKDFGRLEWAWKHGRDPHVALQSVKNSAAHLLWSYGKDK